MLKWKTLDYTAKQRKYIVANACTHMEPVKEKGTTQRSRGECRKHLGCLRTKEDRGKGGSKGRKLGQRSVKCRQAGGQLCTSGPKCSKLGNTP